MAGFEAQDFTPDSLRDTKADLAAQGQVEGFGTDEMIQRMSEDSNLTSDELSAISTELQYDVSNVCDRSQELCSDLKDQIFISRLKTGITLGVNGNRMMIDEGLFSKHFDINIAAIIEENNGGWVSRKIGSNSLEIGDVFTVVLEGEDITFFNGENEAEFKYNINSKEISRDDLGENDQSDDKSIQDIDTEVDKVIEGGIKPFSGGAGEVLVNPSIRKDLSLLTEQDIITFSEEIGLKPHILTSLKNGDYIVVHNFMSDKDLTKIAGLLSVENTQGFVNYYRNRANNHTLGSVLITHNTNSVSFTDEHQQPYMTYNRN